MKKICAIAFGLFFSTMSLTQSLDCSRYGSDRYHEEKGIGKLVGGIVLVTTAFPVAIASGVAVGYASSDCGHRDTDDDQNCRQSERGVKVGGVTAALVLGTFISRGVLKLKDSRPLRRRYKQWKRECYRRPPRRERAEFKFNGLLLDPSSSSLGVGFEF